MSRVSARLLFWSPRILSIAFAIFLSLFALDVFSEYRGFGQIALAFLIHLIPVFVFAAMLLLAWWREWIGALLFLVAAAYYAWLWTMPPRHMNWSAIAVISGPLLVIAALFLATWVERAKVRAAR
jgi:hypothetical protein